MVKRLVWLGASAWALAACGGGDAGPDATPPIDARPIVRTDRAYCVSRIDLPHTPEDVEAQSFDFPGTSRPVNKMGELTTVLLQLAEGLGVEDSVNDGVLSGETLYVYVVRSGPLDEDDPAPTVSYAQVQDADEPPDPSNNLGGQGQMRVLDGTVIVPFIDDASLSDSMLEGEGDPTFSFVSQMRFHPDARVAVTAGKWPKMRATFDADGVDVVVGSLVTIEELQAGLYPTIAETFTIGIQTGSPRAAEISGIYDLDMDGTVTTQELIDNDTMATLVQPDVDIDSDGVYDHLSQAAKVRAVPVELVE
jgi:hypothetical protein